MRRLFTDPKPRSIAVAALILIGASVYTFGPDVVSRLTPVDPMVQALADTVCAEMRLDAPREAIEVVIVGLSVFLKWDSDDSLLEVLFDSCLTWNILYVQPGFKEAYVERVTEWHGPWFIQNVVLD